MQVPLATAIRPISRCPDFALKCDGCVRRGEVTVGHSGQKGQDPGIPCQLSG